jgi:hypothetical protein
MGFIAQRRGAMKKSTLGFTIPAFIIVSMWWTIAFGDSRALQGAPIVSVGSGAYSTQLPLDQDGNSMKGPVSPQPLPSSIPLSAPVQTHDWWTSQVFKWSAKPSQVPLGNRITPQPLTLLPGADGLEIKQMYVSYLDKPLDDAPGFKQLFCAQGQQGECHDVKVYDGTPTVYDPNQGGEVAVQEYSMWFMSYHRARQSLRLGGIRGSRSQTAVWSARRRGQE